MLVPGLDTDIVVSPSYIQLGVDHGSPQVSDQHGDKWKQVLVVHRPLIINILVVLHRPQLPVLLLDEEERQGIRGD